MPQGLYATTGNLDYAILKLFSDRFYSYHPVVPWDDGEPLPATQGAPPRHSGSLMRTIRVAAGLVCHYELLGHLLGHLVQRDTWRSRISNWGESLCGFYHNTKTASEINRLTAQSISRTFLIICKRIYAPLLFAEVTQSVVGGCLGWLEVVPGHSKAVQGDRSRDGLKKARKSRNRAFL